MTNKKILELLQISSHIRSWENCYTHSWGPLSSDQKLSLTILEKLSSGTNEHQLIKTNICKSFNFLIHM